MVKLKRITENAKTAQPYWLSRFLMVTPRGAAAAHPVCLTTARITCGARLAPTSLKTIINRFINARCPHRVRFPEAMQKKRSTPYGILRFFGDPTGNRTPVFAVRGRKRVILLNVAKMINCLQMALLRRL